MAYIGREPQIGNYQICDAISVVNAQAAYTMQVSSVNVIPESVNHMIVSLNGVIQKPGSSYTISSSTITFSSNLATGDSIDFIYLLGNVLDLGTPSDSTVTTAKLSGNLVTPGTLDVNGQELILDADADTSITADTDDQIDIKVAGADDFQITANTLTALSGSTIKADTIAETTGANGVAVDGLTIKDGKLNTNDSVVTANITDANVTSAKLASDAVTTAKITDANVTSAKIAGDAITAAKIADDAISEEHLDVTAITGHTAETSVADGDLVVIHDASASALKKMTVANLTANAGGGKVLQVLQTVKLDTFSTSTALGSFADITGMSQAITPSASNSKILVTICGHTTNEAADKNGFRLVRGSTSIFIGNSRGSTTRVSAGVQQADSGHVANFSITFLDSPSTTNSTTYKLQAGSENGGTLFFGGTSQSGDAHDLSAPASITLMEIGA